ncbi:MAG: aldo/keto reductase, partial [Bacteroidota bacterium]
MIYYTRNGQNIPALGLGTFKLQGEKAINAVDSALGIGYRHIDTARMYENEEAVGQALQNSSVTREDIFLTTKVWYTELDYNSILDAAEDSLRKLRTDYVDLLLIHWPNPSFPLEKSLDALKRLEDGGKTRHIGVSNFPTHLIQRCIDHGVVPVVNQVEYHALLDQQILLNKLRQHDILLTAYCPIGQGKLRGNAQLQEIGRRY